MPSPTVAWSSLVLLAGFCLPFQGQKKWKPLFDYTNLQPSNQAYWEPLGRAHVEMEKALELAAKDLGAAIRVLSADLKTGDGDAFWQLELFAGGEEGTPKRVNVRVSAAEEKVLQRLELLSLAEEDKQTWAVLAKAQVPAEAAIDICKQHSVGVKPEPLITDPRLRTLEFVPEAGAPIWKCELMGLDKRKQQIRRYSFSVNAARPMVKQRLMLDRFAGEPLRGDQPRELENGMFLHDFTVGEGGEVKADSKVKVNYRLFLLDNTKLHDTWETHRPETFLVSNAPLEGMTEGMVGMRVGGKRKIAMPYHMAFGEAGNELAPPRAMIVCDVAVEALVNVNR
jgi:FKBP-type peptidyl-prolyl cis-trans isomerase